MIGENLRKLRKSHGLTQQNIADVLGLERTAYTCYELDNTNPSIETMKKLCDIYNVTMGYLCGYEENSPELKKKKVETIETPDKDALALLSKEEKMIILSYRVLSSEKREEFVNYVNKFKKL